MTTPIRVGVVGLGHLGSKHAEIYAKLPGVRLEAVCDIDAAKADALSQRLGCESVTDFHKLQGLVDAVSLAVPTNLHAEVGLSLLASGIHLLIVKPISATLPDGLFDQ